MWVSVLWQNLPRKVHTEDHVIEIDPRNFLSLTLECQIKMCLDVYVFNYALTSVSVTIYTNDGSIYRKDDEELRVGASVSKIIVPHPALQTFVSVEVLYTAYSGWLTSGLARWSVDKISLMDTFGKK